MISYFQMKLYIRTSVLSPVTKKKHVHIDISFLDKER